MKLLVVNPNTTPSMTDRIGQTARSVALADTQVVAVNPTAGPASIEGYYDEALSLAGLIETVGEHPDADAIVIACFDDTGLDAVRCMTRAPVLGIGEAAYHVASMIANHFSVVTTLSRSVPALQHNLVRYGLASRCACVRASDVPVLELESDSESARALIDDQISAAIEQDRAEAIVLGCAGMTSLAESLTEQHGLPVVDGVASAVVMAEALVRSGAHTSKIGGYAWPLAK